MAGIYFKDDGKDAWEEFEAQAVCHSLAYNREEPAGPSVSFSGRLVTESTLGPRSRVWALLQWPGQRPGQGQQLRTGGKSMLCNRLWSLASSFSPARLTEKVVCGVWKTYRQKAPNNSGLSTSQFASPTAQGPCGLLRPSDPSCPVWSRRLLPFEPSGRSPARRQDGGGERDARVPQRHSGSSRATLARDHG